MSGAAKRTALVAGGAGSIGRAIAVRLAAEGIQVVAADLSPQRLAEVQAATPGVEIVAADMSSPDGVESAPAATDGPGGIMCNKVGRSARRASGGGPPDRG